IPVLLNLDIAPLVQCSLNLVVLRCERERLAERLVDRCLERLFRLRAQLLWVLHQIAEDRVDAVQLLLEIHGIPLTIDDRWRTPRGKRTPSPTGAPSAHATRR